VSSTIDVGALLDDGPWTAQQKRWTILAALAIIFDGFDIQILGFAIPSMIREWHVARSAFGPVLALGLAGMAVGSPLAGYFGDRFGRRTALINCVSVFGLATIASSFVDGVAGWPCCASSPGWVRAVRCRMRPRWPRSVRPCGVATPRYCSRSSAFRSVEWWAASLRRRCCLRLVGAHFT
jgi:MFS family permease